VARWRDGDIAGVEVRPLERFADARGWLAEIFRGDSLDPALLPAMGYVSVTRPGVTRGPHEHRAQTDYFCFPGPGTFQVYLWDARPSSPTRGCRRVVAAGADAPAVVVVPPGVVHAYRNAGDAEGLVINLPNALYRGPDRRGEVDEIRHEDDPASPYRLEDVR
jgi:dTDP-4-dehydrorhamnose 3,5-epimerase